MKKFIYIAAATIALLAIFAAVRPAFALPCYQTSQGGTGDCPTGTVPYGDLLVSNGAGKYSETATSSLGITANASWGSITGTLSNQTDLQNALNAKVGLTSFSALFPLFYNNGTGVFSIEATSSFGCTVSCFASHNISQWTNDAGYLTSLAGAASSTLLSDNNTWSGNNTWTASSTMQKQLNLQGASSTLFTCTTCYGGTLALTTALPVSSGGTGLTSTSQNFFFAGPTSGSGAPTWRAIVAGDVPTLNQNTTGSAGSVANAVTFNSGGSGASSGSTFNGSSALTVSYNTIGAQVAGTYVTAVNGTTNQITSSGGTSPTLSLPNLVVFPIAASSTLFSNFGTAYFGGTATATINSLGDALFQQATTSSFYDNNVTSALALFDANHREGAFAGSNCSAGAAPTGISATGAVQNCTTYTQGGITTLGNYASTTGTAISLSTSTETTNGVTLGVIAAVSNNAILFTPTISGTLANAGLANSTISGVALGGTLGALSHGSTLTGTSYTGTSAVSNWDIDLTHANSWTGLQNFTGGASSSVFSINVGPLYVGGTTATTTISANATSTFATGLNLTTGCVTYQGGLCLGAAGTFIGGTSLAVQLATTGALPANAYSGGVLTEVGTGALTVDGTAAAVGNRILVKNEVAQTNNGIYSVTAAGSGIAAYVLTRVSDYNSSANVYPGEATYVVGGSTLADDWWALTTVAPITVGGGGSGSNLTYVETNAAGSGVTSVGLSSPGSTITVGSTPVTSSGTITADLNLANSNWWTARQNFTNATSSGLEATSTNVYFDGYTSALLSVNGSHQLTAYGGASACSNQFVTALSALGATTCATVSLTAAVSGTLPIANGGTDQTSFTGTNALINFDGTHLSAPSTGYTLSSTLLTAPNASTTNLTATGFFQMPSAANPEPTIKASCSQSTNSPYQIQCGNNAGGTSVYDSRTGISFYISSTTAEIEWYYANPTAYTSVTATYWNASSTPGQNAIASNNTPATNATSTMIVGNFTGSPTSVSCNFFGPITGI
jgi:hypothetical protein